MFCHLNYYTRWNLTSSRIRLGLPNPIALWGTVLIIGYHSQMGFFIELFKKNLAQKFSIPSPLLIFFFQKIFLQISLAQSRPSRWKSKGRLHGNHLQECCLRTARWESKARRNDRGGSQHGSFLTRPMCGFASITPLWIQVHLQL